MGLFGGLRRVETGAHGGDRAGAPAFLRLPPAPVRRMRRPLILAGWLAGVALLAYSYLGDGGLRTYLELRREERELQEEVRELQERRARLQAELDALADDPAALERVARERYRMLREGERIIEVVDDPEAVGDR